MTGRFLDTIGVNQYAQYIFDYGPTLAVWGKNDAFFIPPGAEAYRRDNPEAEIHLLDAGHFALETHAREIADLVCDFLARKLPE